MNTQILIAGGGPVGLALAIELGQRGIHCLVVERHHTPLPIPRGQNLTQRTMEHMQAWGIEPAIRAARTIPPEYGIGGLTAYGTLLGPYTYDWLQRELVRPFYAKDNERLPQYATEAVLRARAATLPTVTTLYGSRVDTVEQDATGVTATLSGDDPGPVRATYAVGCDGARSVVREHAGITQTRSDHDRLMVLLVFRSTELHELLARYPGKSFYCVLHPSLQGYWQFFGRVDLGSTWFFHAPVPPDTTQDSLDAGALLRAALGTPFAFDLEHVGFWDLRFAVADTYRAGRLFIAGDAAHSHPPYGGYGINTGFEDARNLGWKLAATLNGWAGPNLLDTYGAERQPVFASTARDFIERSIHADRDFLAAFDPAADRPAFEREWDRRRIGASSEVGAFEPHYAPTPTAVGRHVHAAQPGHHLTPQSLSSGQDVFDAFGPNFTLIALDTDPKPFQAAAHHLGIPLTSISDTNTGGRERWNAPLILVRPDHFVAWCGNPPPNPAIILQAAIDT